MESIIKDLFFGKIKPSEKLTPKDNPEYAALMKQIKGDREYFKTILSADDFTRLDGYEVSNDLIADMQSVEAFTLGFRLGAAIVAEVYQSKDAPPDIWKLLGLDKPHT
jgi:hypothetical protein